MASQATPASSRFETASNPTDEISMVSQLWDIFHNDGAADHSISACSPMMLPLYHTANDFHCEGG